MTEQDARAEEDYAARAALIAIRDAYDRTMDMRPVCDDEFYAAVQEALNRVCDSDGNFITPEAAPSDTDPRNFAHIECDCVPDIGPSHCHLCSERAGHPVPWSEAHPQPVQVEPEGYEHCKSCGSRMWAGQLIRRNDSGRAVEHQNCDHPYHPAAEPVQVEVTEQAVVTLAKHMANVASDWTDVCGDDDHPLGHSNWEAYTGDARRALADLGGGE